MESSIKPRSERSDLRLSSFLPYLLTQLAEGASKELSQIYAKDFGLSVPEWRIIANLAEHGTLSARQIVDFTHMEKSKISRAVKNLSNRNLVTQQRASSDFRAKDLALTSAGSALYRSIVPQVLAWEKELIEGLAVDEYRDLLFLLDKLNQRLGRVSSR